MGGGRGAETKQKSPQRTEKEENRWGMSGSFEQTMKWLIVFHWLKLLQNI